MNSIRQHVNNAMKYQYPEPVPFTDKASLLAIPWVAEWMSRPGFHRFSMEGNRLMAEYQNGRLWYVVGYLKEPVEGLPVWGS